MKIKDYTSKKVIKNSKKCGCYYCLSVFKKEEITEYIDKGETALCPKCNIDSVIGNNKTIVKFNEFLQKLHVHYFCWNTSIKGEYCWSPTKNYQKFKNKNKLKKFRF